MGQIVEDLLHAFGAVISGADAVTDQLRGRHADADGHALEMEQFQESVIPHLQTVLFVEHAQPVRHVVERDVEAVCLLLEARGEGRFLARHRQGLNDDVANAKRDVHHSVYEHQHHETHRPVHPIGIEKQRESHWQRAKRELPDGDERSAGVTAGNRGGVAC